MPESRSGVFVSEMFDEVRPILERYDTEVRSHRGVSKNYGWVLAEHLYRGTPQHLMDESWARVREIAEDEGFEGSLAEDGILFAGWCAYRQGLQHLHMAGRLDLQPAGDVESE